MARAFWGPPHECPPGEAWAEGWFGIGECVPLTGPWPQEGVEMVGPDIERAVESGLDTARDAISGVQGSVQDFFERLGMVVLVGTGLIVGFALLGQMAKR